MPDPKPKPDPADRFSYDIGDLEVDNTGVEDESLLIPEEEPDTNKHPPKDIHIHL